MDAPRVIIRQRIQRGAFDASPSTPVVASQCMTRRPNYGGFFMVEMTEMAK
ncbi:MAG TPA: hypothetical protein VK049_05245 [Paenalcaligenes sp.]|nr:hypothetical protein [Paenalcaligenes sp.]